MPWSKSTADQQNKTTKSYYEKVIKQMRGTLAPGTEGLDFLTNWRAVKTWIEDGRSLNSKKTYYAVVKSVVRDWTLKEASALPALTATGAMEHYAEAFKKFAAEQKKVNETQKATPREAEALVAWPEIVNATREMVREAIESHQAQLLQDAALMACYAYTPPRRLDYSPMRVVKRRNKKIPDNHLIVNKNKMVFVFKEYKTSKTYGTQEVKVPPSLELILRAWLDLNTGDWLFTNHDGGAMSEACLSAHLIRLFERRMGKKIGVDILRHSYISHLREGEMPLAQKQELANQMGHSVATNELYRRV
jgi:integrase